MRVAKKTYVAFVFAAALVVPQVALAQDVLRFQGARITQAAGQTEMSAEAIYASVSSAVFTIYALDAAGRANTQGSAVAIAPRFLLTNCHVLRTENIVLVSSVGLRIRAIRYASDPDKDKCVLVSESVLVTHVPIRGFASIRVGERVYAIGSPQGLQATLTDGLVSAVRSAGGLRFIQTTAPISKGSSGGGLFDRFGNLVGITTLFLRDAQSLNFAIAAEDFLNATLQENSLRLPQPLDSIFRSLDAQAPAVVAGDADARNCERASSDPPSGIAACTRLITAHARSPTIMKFAYYNRGNAFAVLNQYYRAHADYGRATEIDPKHSAAHANRSIAWYAIQSYGAAIIDADRAIALAPLDPNFHNLRGVYHRAIGKYEAAIRDYDRAIGLKADFAQAYNNRGNAFFLQGNYKRAIENYDKAITLVPAYASAYQNRAGANEALGNSDAAIRNYTMALRLDPGLTDSRAALVRLGVQPATPRTPGEVPPTQRSAPLSVSEIDAIKRQIRPCWLADAGDRGLGSLVVVIDVWMNEDGTVRQARVAPETRIRSAEHRAAADRALRAVLNERCQPFKLPPEKYARWRQMKLEFDPTN